ncbi:MAG TPA: ABC transporter ATP-binding protein, partial [Dongiaceae bacterium]
MLAVTDLTAAYGRIRILNGISFAVAEREFVGILGHNGMGKTTLLKTLIGAVRATGGQIRFDDRDVTAMPAYRRGRLGIGYVPQGREIFASLSVLDNLRMATAALGARDRDVIEPVLEDFPRLKSLLDRPGGALSGGEQQLLALARCLCGRPRLILLDEPTEGIQPSIIEEIAERLAMLRDRRGLTV